MLSKGLAVASSNGSVWRIDKAATTSGKLVSASRGAASGLQPPFAAAVEMGQGRAMMGSSAGKPSAIVFDPASRRTISQVDFAIPNRRLAVPPIAQTAGGFVVCSTDGPIYLVDDAGQKKMDPFQPEIEPGSDVKWLMPAEVNGNVFAAEENGTLYRLAEKPKPKKHLAMLATAMVEGKSLKGQLALVGSTLFAIAGDASAAPDELLAFSANGLKPSGSTDLGAKVVWGPTRFNMGRPALLVSTEDNRLHLFGQDGKKIWQAALPSQLAGAPVLANGKLICACVGGQLASLDATSGNNLPWGNAGEFYEVGRPLGAGPALSGSRLVLLGQDSTVLFARLPTN